MTTITAVITCYREGELIYNALDSLYDQTDREFNIIIVNGCSPDETTNNVCRDIEKSNKAELIWNEVNQGMGISRNTAFEKMTTDVAVFLDADDTLPPEAIASIRKMFDQNPDADFIFGNYQLLYLEKNTTEMVDCSVLVNENGQLSPNLLANNWIFLGSSPCKKSLWKKIGGYSYEFSNTTNDVDFWQRAIMVGAKGYYLNENIYNWNRSIHGLNSSPAFKKALDSCNYKNIDFVIRYCDIYKEAYNLSIENNNYKKIKEWAIHEIEIKKNSTVLALLYYKSPLFIIPLLSKTHKMLKKWLK
jgi:glycosyltransferase involved in cell wall biosynthesis